MNSINLSFTEKVKIAEMSGRTPQGKGVKFVEWKELNLNQIQQRTNNKLTLNAVRADQLDQKTIASFVERIQQGRYLYSYDQPVVEKYQDTDTYQLVCGEHRLQSHYLAGLKTMFVAVVEFDNSYDKLVFQSNENLEEEEYVKNPRTPGDVILTLSEMVRMGGIDLEDDKSINKALTDLHQIDKDYPKLRERLRNEFGKSTPVKSWDDTSKKNWLMENYPEIKISTRSRVFPINNVVYMSRTFKGGKGTGGLRDLDYDSRCFFDTCRVLMKHPDCVVMNIAHYNDANSEKIPKLRKYKETKMFEEWQKFVLDIAEQIQQGRINPCEQVRWKHMPQINEVESIGGFVS